MVRLKEKLKSCGQETFPIANKNNRSIPAHTWANDNTVLLETKKNRLFFFLFSVPTAVTTVVYWVMGSTAVVCESQVTVTILLSHINMLINPDYEKPGLSRYKVPLSITGFYLSSQNTYAKTSVCKHTLFCL